MVKIVVKNNSDYVYVCYSRQNTSINKVETLQSELLHIIENELINNEKNLVLDFSDMDFLYSPEIGIIAFTTWELKKLGRQVFIISSKEVEDILEKTALKSIENLSFGVRD